MAGGGGVGFKGEESTAEDAMVRGGAPRRKEKDFLLTFFSVFSVVQKINVYNHDTPAVMARH